MVVNQRLIERPVVRDYGARWTLLRHQIEGGIDELRRFITYLGTVQDDNAMETFGAALKRHGLDLGGEIMTYAEKLLAEGEARGEEARREVEWKLRWKRWKACCGSG